MQHVNQIVDGDNAQYIFIIRVYHRQGQEIVTHHQIGAIFLVGVGCYVNHIGVHQLSNGGFGIGHNKLAQVDDAHQSLQAIRHKQIIDCFLIGMPGANGGDALLGGPAALQRNISRRHQPAGGVVGIIDQGFNLVGGLQARQNGPGLGRFHIIQQVGGFIRLHLIHNTNQRFEGQLHG